MTLIIELTPEEEERVRRRAAALGLDEHEYAHRLLQADLQSEPASTGDLPKTPAEIVAYWEREGVLGMRPDITDSVAHARKIRRQAESRGY